MSTVSQREPENQPTQPHRDRDKVLHVRVRHALQKRLRIAAAQEEKSISEIVEEALENHLSDERSAA